MGNISVKVKSSEVKDHYFKRKRKNHVKRNRGSSWCIVCLYYSFYEIVNLCNSIIGDIVEFLTVYTFKFIYVMFVLWITIWISKKHVDFCNKDAIWNGSQLEKKKDETITKFQKIWIISEPFQNYNNHQKSCNSDLFWKESACKYACSWESVLAVYVYLCWVHINGRVSRSMKLLAVKYLVA